MAKAVQPGDVITDGRILSTGRGGLLILKGSGLQLTLSENTSIHLPAPGITDITLNHGWLRVRAATAANRKARVATTHFDIQSSSTVFVIRANHDGATLSVDSGSVVLATMDGQHRAVLAAGAGAMVDRTTSDDLMIRRASNEPFSRMAPLSTEEPDSLASSPMTPRPAIDGPANTPEGNTIIRPASRPALKAEGERAPDIERDNEAQVTAQGTPHLSRPDIIPAVSRTAPVPLSVEPLDPGPSNDPAMSSSRNDDNMPSPGQATETADELDLLQMQFDLLTDGLTDNL